MDLSRGIEFPIYVGPGDQSRPEVSGNLVVFRTKAGLAPAVAYQIDAMDLPEVLGTVAGEDTLLAVVAEGYNPVQVKEKLRRLISER